MPKPSPPSRPGGRALERCYLLTITLSADGLKTCGWDKLADAQDVPHEGDGTTPLGAVCQMAADELEGFVPRTPVEAGCRARPPQVLVISDCSAHETKLDPAVTRQGVDSLVAVLRKLRGNTTVVAPAAAGCDQAVARRRGNSIRASSWWPTPCTGPWGCCSST